MVGASRKNTLNGNRIDNQVRGVAGAAHSAAEFVGVSKASAIVAWWVGRRKILGDSLGFLGGEEEMIAARPPKAAARGKHNFSYV